MTRSVLNVEQILKWADAHYKRTGKWPMEKSGAISGTADETWASVQGALVNGCRGQPGGSSLPRFLSEHRGRRLWARGSDLTVEQILKWADAHSKRTGKWPTGMSGPIVGADDKWGSVNAALASGGRGLPGGSSLARLLSERRGVPIRPRRPDLTVEQILKWADAHRKRTGKLPAARSGPVFGVAESMWSAIDIALAEGRRGLPGGSSLARLLSEHRGRRLWGRGENLTVEQILKWADAHYKRTGKWPTITSGRIAGAVDTTWNVVQTALVMGHRGLPGSSTLARLLSEYRGKRIGTNRTELNVKQILKWADAHRKRTGKWPASNSGRIVGADDETWRAVQGALVYGCRGFPGGSSLARLLSERRGAPIRPRRPELNVKQILKWADAHRKRTGNWPTQRSGPVVGTDDESWSGIEGSLKSGRRGLPGGSSLAKLRAKHRIVGRVS